MANEVIKQVTIFTKNGTCVLNFNYWGARLNKELFSCLLSAIDGFAVEALGVELREIATQEHHVFLKRTDELTMAVVAEKSVGDDLEARANILSLLEPFCQIFESVNQSWTQTGSNPPVWLQQEIKRKIARMVPTSWSRFTPDTQSLNDLAKIRILTYLSDQKTHSLTKVANWLHLPRPIIKEKLSTLNQEGFITVEKTPFGRKERRTYTISEMGKLALNELETRFPGLWF